MLLNTIDNINHQFYHAHGYNRPYQPPTTPCLRIQHTKLTTNTTMLMYTKYNIKLNHQTLPWSHKQHTHQPPTLSCSYIQQTTLTTNNIILTNTTDHSKANTTMLTYTIYHINQQDFLAHVFNSQHQLTTLPCSSLQQAHLITNTVTLTYTTDHINK
ncbi:unnamed protein product [Mytilus edulis]|uniref:Uncharacterized protein n=1 Tax=Mytilus edulis TaxID=6550 RepID=A0A8S3SMJ5_MYTED|nr:unnamed protein product [Mytilus edulis]